MLGDELCSVLAACFGGLRNLDVTGTRIGVDGLDILLRGLPDLSWISVEGCRSLPVRGRHKIVLDRLAVINGEM